MPNFVRGAVGSDQAVDTVWQLSNNGIFHVNSPWVDFTPSGGEPIPEPSTLVLFGLGFLGVLGYGLHRKRRK
ncbi:PEP-CTERM sorting domain-containing protein [bacterium]|nr:PEP-CTERM sorting domain-containing protein [bacterium]